MFVKRLNVEFEVIGKCCAREDGIEFADPLALRELELCIRETIARAWIFPGKISTLIVEADNALLNASILEDCYGFMVDLTDEEVRYLIGLC